MDSADSLVSLRGHLTQQMSIFPKNKKWFCILSSGILSLYTDTNPSTLSLEIPISQITDVFLSPNSNCVFQFTFNNEKYLFICGTSFEAQKWIHALQAIPESDDREVNVDTFDLLYLIGKGRYGKVFLTRHKKNKKLYAIKVIRKSRLNKEVLETHIVPERNILMLSNKNHFITRLHYAFQTDIKIYLVLDFIPGGDLSHHLDEGIAFSAEQIQLYLAEVIIALDFLHSMNYIYRDLKPENILIDCDGHIKLADFGLAREMDTVHRSICGTHEYLAPEVTMGQPQSIAIDFWALGVLAFRLIVGRLPFESSNMDRLFYQIQNRKPQFPPNIDENAKDFIEQLLQKNPDKRLKSPEIRKHPYFRNFDFDKAEKCQYTSQFKPEISHLNPVNNFNEELTEEIPVDSYRDSSDISLNLSGFSYMDPHSFDSDHEEEEEQN